MDRSEITPALASRLVAEQFPQWRGLPVEPVAHAGWDNVTFRLGHELLVRLPSAEIYAAQVLKEQRWLPSLAAQLPLAIPQPLGRGVPGCGYPWAWSIYRRLEGDPASGEQALDPTEVARDLARFLSALYAIDSGDGPPAGEHNFFRGGSLSVYDAETRQAIALLTDRIDASAATGVWDAALESPWSGLSVWVHGDVVSSNLLVQRGRLRAVIDFGCCGVGDPSCDLTIAWTFFAGHARAAFRTELGLDDATWARARGWALWKALVTLAHDSESAARRLGWRQSAAGLIEDILAG